MIQLTLNEIGNILGLNNAPTNIECRGLSIDSRTIQPGNLFIAIKGESLDGHDYVQEAHKKGAIAAIVSQKIACDIPQLLVTDTTLALGTLGAAWRNRFNLPILAVTGSNGKTTLKNMLATILTAACNGDSNQVLANIGTLNNQWGVPLTLARLGNQHHYAVIEMGMNHFGEIDYLTHLTRPHIAAITNAAESHLEGVGSVEGVARAKAEIFLGLSQSGIAILNRDDAFFTYWREIIGTHDYLTFGFHPDADVRADAPEQTSSTKNTTVSVPQGKIDIALPLLGKHNVLNMLAAVATTLAAGIELTVIKTALENIKPVPGRLQLHTLANGVNIIDDTYNANPFSLQAAINTLAAFHGKKILVLGDMKELGSDTTHMHTSAGELIRKAGIDFLFTYGELSEKTSHAFGEGAYHFSEQEKLVNALKPFLHNTTTILVKGSRSMHMEKVVAGLVH